MEYVHDRESQTSIRRASSEDLDSIAAVLSASHLSTVELETFVDTFLVAQLQDRIVGTAGLECYGGSGLVRSVAVLPDYQGLGLGKKLVVEVERLAIQLGLNQLLLLTETASAFFAQQGFKEVERNTVSGEIRKSRQFIGACPASATVMLKHL